MNQIQKEEKLLLKQFINDFFYKKSIDGNYKSDLYKMLIEYHIASPIEVIIRPECNQKCEYCYITNHGNELYPLEERKTKEELITNFEILFNYFEKQKMIIPQMELFAGDLFYDDLIYSLFEILYSYYNKIYETESFCLNFIMEKNIPNFRIIIPSNFSFVNDSRHLPKLKEWQNKFIKINVKINFSVSADGKYATKVRENKQNNEVDQYYDKIIQAGFELKAGFHPMISSETIENYIQNYDWWLEQLAKYNSKLPFEKQFDFSPTFLEVRNNTWTKEKIDSYVLLLNHMIDKRIELFNGNIELLASHLFNNNNNNIKMNNSDVLRFPIRTFSEHSPCTLTGLMHINLQNMAIVPCHRLTYYQFIGGKFIIENNEIIDIDPINPSGYIGIMTMNYHYQPKCDNCALNNICMKGCLGSQYETSGELFVPNNSVCNLFHAKYKTLISRYNQLGIFKIAKKYNYLHLEQIILLQDICNYLDIPLDLGE